MIAAARAAIWMPAIRKEARALAPAWVIALAAAVLAARFPLLLVSLGLVVYVVGAAIVGALSMGHELNDGTLATLLVQPRRRRDLLLTKLAVLVPLEIALGIPILMRSTLNPYVIFVVMLPALCGICVAPWLTIVCRSALAGAVFTTAVPAAWAVLGALMAPFLRGAVPSDVIVASMLAGTSLVFVIGSAAGWRAFMRLEVVEGSSRERADAEAPAPARSAVAVPAAGPRRPLALLARKEMRLQLLPLAVAAVFAVVCVSLALGERRPDDVFREIDGITPFYVGLTALLIGALPSAAERELGTTEAQVMLPMATALQWLVKVVSAVVSAELLTVALPALVCWAIPATRALVTRDAMMTGVTLSIGLVLVGLYVSSLSRSGLWAFLVSLPATMAFWMVAVYVGLPPRMFGRTVFDRLAGFWMLITRALFPHGLASSVLVGLRHATDVLSALVVAMPFAVALVFALRNHRSVERGAGRIVRQIAWMAIVVAVTGTAWAGVSTAARWDGRIAKFEAFRAEIQRLPAGMDGRVGISVVGGVSEYDADEAVSFPMAGVSKVLVAFAVLDDVDHGALNLSDPVVVHREDLSVPQQPLARVVGPGGFKTTIDDLLQRAIVDDDDTAADVLMARIGGPEGVNRALKGHKYPGTVHVNRDERHIESDIRGLTWRPEFANPGAFERAAAAVPNAERDAALSAYAKDLRDTATPGMMANLLRGVAGGFLLSPRSTSRFLELLAERTAGTDPLKAVLPIGWSVLHLTATSDTWRGITGAANDVGLLRAPDGHYVTFAVFIAGTRSSPADRAALVQRVVRTAIDFY